MNTQAQMKENMADIEERALDWLIRLDGTPLSKEEQAEFDAWLAERPRHHVAFLRAQAAWNRASRLKHLRSLNGVIDENLLEPQELAWRKWAPAVLAACLLIALGVWVAMPSGWKTYRTDIGSATRIVLEDGSTVNLNTNSRIRVRLTAEERSVKLTQGEALFTVARDPQRPFDVHAGDTVVRALGTAFSVRLVKADTIEVLVAEGSVKMLGAASTPTLSAGEMASVRPQSVRKARISPDEVPRKLAWKEGRLWFDREPLVQAVEEFNRYNRKRLMVGDPAIADLRIGGGFEVTDPESFVAALERSFGVKAIAPPAGDSEAPIRLVSADEKEK